MKKIAVLTWFNRGRNYGQTLQAFALNHTLREMGCQCELLSYGRNGPRLSQEEINELTGKQRELQIKFTSFIKCHIDYSIRLKTPEEVERYLQGQNFDAVICGSDQIWNLALRSFEGVYMLNFDIPCRKISYAAGMMNIGFLTAARKYPQVSAWLEDFAAVSVRENSARTIVRKLTDGRVDAAVVLDPTMLLTAEEWTQAVELPQLHREPYIFCYMFHLSEGQKSLIQKLAQAYHCDKVVFLDRLRSGNPQLEGIKIEITQAISIEMFLALIRNAAAVVTDSFHGTVFSILFEREFYSLESDSEEPERNIDRVLTLLGKVELVSRMLKLGEEGSVQIEKTICYPKVKERLAAERESSLCWLRQAVLGGKNT